MVDTALTGPRPGRTADAAVLAQLFCTGEREICLKPHVCSSDNRPQLIAWLEKECSARHLWTINKGLVPVGMLILHDQSIAYVVVDPQCRGKGIGTNLVRNIQAKKNIASLHAEARNDLARRMFVGCGFQQDGETHCGYRMKWERVNYP